MSQFEKTNFRVVRRSDSWRRRLGCLASLPGMVSAFSSGTAFASDIISEVSSDEVVLPEVNLSGETLEEAVVVKRLQETDIPQESPTVAKESNQERREKKREFRFRPARETLLPQATARELMETDEAELLRVGKVFQAIVSSTTVSEESRLAFLENSDEGNRRVADGRFDPKKVYSFDAEGHLVEVIPSLVTARKDQKTIEGNGWTVLAANEAEEKTSNTAVALRETGKSERDVGVPIGSGLLSAEGVVSESELRLASQTKSASRGGPVLSIEPEMIASEVASPGGAPASALSDATTTAVRFAVKGRISLPDGASPTDVRIRVGGTDIEIVPDEYGAFEIPEIPRGAKFELVVWDIAGKLVRRLIPVSAVSPDREIQFVMESSNRVDALARAFGGYQDMLASGFCGKVDASNPALLLGAKIEVRTPTRPVQPKFFGTHGFPAKDLTELGQDGRFCAFNLDPGLTDVSIDLANGMRRRFTIHTKASTFENDLSFDMVSAIYRPVVASELVDFDEALNATARGQTLVFGTPGVRSWYDGQRSATWTRVTSVAVSGDKAHAGTIYEGKSDEWAYFQLADELVEVRAGKNPDDLSVFRLVGRDELKTEGMKKVTAGNDESAVFREYSEPLRLPILPDDALDEMQRDTGVTIDRTLGTAFVDIDLGALGLSYNDVRVSARDIWTSERVGKVSFVTPQAGAINPRFLRVWVTELPAGHHALVISSKAGSLFGLQVLRSRPGDFQIISVAE